MEKGDDDSSPSGEEVGGEKSRINRTTVAVASTADVVNHLPATSSSKSLILPNSMANNSYLAPTQASILGVQRLSGPVNAHLSGIPYTQLVTFSPFI